MARVTLADLNALDEGRFVARLGAVFEHSPWVAEQAWKSRPFDSIDSLHRAMLGAVRDAEKGKQLSLIREQPELAGRLAPPGAKAPASSGEQERLGFMNLDRSHFVRIGELNRRYRQRFGFACVVALKLHASRASVMAEMRRRLGNTADAEKANALEQIGHIARGRLEEVLGSG